MSSSEPEDMVNGYEDADDDFEDNGYEYLENFEELTDLIQENCPDILRKFWEPVKTKELELSRSRYVTNPSPSTVETAVVELTCICSTGRADGKFGGSNPFRGNNFSWPRCSDKDCGRQKSFICQINLATIPDQSIRHLLKEFGLFQCFFCSNMYCSRDWYEEQEGDHVRFIPKSEMIPSLKTLASFVIFESKADTGNLPKVLQEFVEKNNEQFEDYDEQFEDDDEQEYVGEEKQVKSWKESNLKEVPLPHEMTSNDKLSNRLLALPGITEDRIDNIDLDKTKGAGPIVTPQGGVKIGGYVLWFERDFVGYSRCEDCELEMDIPFVQLAWDEDLQEFDWFSGSANITLCPGCGKPNLYWKFNP